ncbi:hypothetical protein EWM64_g6763 [Hericium alpestre]|uniref:PWWP domain-containing protein n=1 Tax=Hericium alpestre TaxID=135208 RepID=A0A4Y9ZTU7_9AGAM|nr:hypothetical protein EWM64_g6763 [Hericium alpestre]
MNGVAFWMPPPPDPFLTIPGELILAVERKRKTEYWPARIEEYVPPTKPSAKQKYRVRFLDDKTVDLERECFFTSTERGFATCKVGVFESAVDQDENDAESESEDDRGESPEPKLPPPKRERFCDLSMREQFAYAKPVVHAILNDSFGPARERHSGFVQGGASRQKLKKQGTGKGDLSSQEVTQLGNLINRWVLRDDRHATKITEEELAVFSAEDAPMIPGEASETHRQAVADAPVTESFIRPNSPAPSVLTELADVNTAPHLIDRSTHLERQVEPPPPSQTTVSTVSTLGSEWADTYCSLVLLHEVVLQILLWRNEKRKALELLEPEEEERLHRVALGLSEERDWVPMVMNMRRTQVKILEAKKAKASSLDALWKGDEPPKAPESAGGTRSRPRRQSSVRH